jgi:hypothetical protein
MSQQIDITEEIYLRLAKHARGFDTPVQVIERMIDFYEEKAGLPTKMNTEPPDFRPHNFQLEIKFFPDNEEDFKRRFLAQGFAWIVIHKTDGSVVEKRWDIQGFTSNSSLKGNLRSGRLRGWREKGIHKAEIAINRDDIK